MGNPLAKGACQGGAAYHNDGPKCTPPDTPSHWVRAAYGKTGCGASCGTVIDFKATGAIGQLCPLLGDVRGTFSWSPHELAPILVGYSFLSFADRSTVAQREVEAPFLLVLSASLSNTNPPVVHVAWQAFKCCCFVTSPLL